MDYRELRSLLWQLECSTGRWEFYEAWWNPHPQDWLVTLQQLGTGRWYTLDTSVDLFDREPVLPLPTAPPPPPGASGRETHDGGDLTWSELLSICDEAAGDYPRWMLHHLKRTEHDPLRYQVHLIHQGGPAVLLPAAYEYYWVDRYVDWARLRHKPLPVGWVLPPSAR
ncbi:MAG TPA: hypothetical protein VLA19_26860 [Herpetosiphonaceae bacterium]|nr:hypothetical protein [Herpetosiphonaceae bacterium]